MNDSNDTLLGFFLGAIVLAPLYALVGILTSREYERHVEEQRMREQLSDAVITEGEMPPGGPGGPMPGPQEPIGQSAETIPCAVCGEPNEVPPSQMDFECDHCGHRNKI